MSLPIAGEFAYRMAEGDFKEAIQNDSAMYHRILGAYLNFLFLPFYHNIWLFQTLSTSKKSTPSIVNFLNQTSTINGAFTIGFW
jgi:hypothetical protein